MAVVDVQEHVNKFGRLTGWAVVEWDGSVESSRFVHAHKGEPDTPLDEDARAEWEAWTADRHRAKRWAADVWKAARRTDFPIEVGDEKVMTCRMPVGHPVFTDGRVVGVLQHDTVADLVGRCVYVGQDGGSEWQLLPGRFMTWPKVSTREYTAAKFTTETLARKRRNAVRELVPGDGLWDMVFAWPENEWESRWAIFIDALRDDYFAWGDARVRTGDHLAAADWKPPRPLTVTALWGPDGAAFHDYIDKLHGDIASSVGVPARFFDVDYQ